MASGKNYGSSNDVLLEKKTPEFDGAYKLALKRAEKDGRLSGAHRCPICGMRFHTKKEAEVCCEKAPKLDRNKEGDVNQKS